MPLALEQDDRNELHAILAQYGLDVVLQEIAWMLLDAMGDVDEELRTAMLRNAFDITKASDSITYRAYTGQDLYECERTAGVDGYAEGAD